MTFFRAATTTQRNLLIWLLLLVSVAAPTSTVAQTSTSQVAGFAEISPGVEYLQLRRGVASKDESTGPWLINLLRVDLSRNKLRLVRAMDEGVGLETVSSLAIRHGALAGINSGYFRTNGTYRGDPLGVFKLNGSLMSETYNDRAALGLIEQAGYTDLVFGHLRYAGKVMARSNSHPVAGINRLVAADELVVFTPQFHVTTLTSSDGIEVVVRRNRVTSVQDLKGSTRIPADGYVISALGKAREWIKTKLFVGALVKLTLELKAVESSQENLWQRSRNIVGGGPQLIKNGKIDITNEEEKIVPAFVSDRHPRTAIARLTSGKILLVTVDGRQPGISVGMSLTQLAELLLEFGAAEAMNLDGGGSTTMVIKNKIVNKPSDQTGERAVSDALLIFPRR